MDAVFATHELGAEERRELQARRDAPGLARLGVQLGVWLVCAGVVVVQPFAWWWLALAGVGVMQAGMFACMHECGHLSAFGRRRLNQLGLVAGAILMLNSWTAFRHFHFEHHRHTHVEGDPELPRRTLEFAGWPTNPIAWVVVMSGQVLVLGKLAVLLATAIGRPRSWWDTWMPFVPVEERGRVGWESRLILALFVALALLGAFVAPGFAWLLLGWPLAHLVLGPLLSAEHTGLASDADVLARTRSIATIAPIRWLLWNMPYHAEHHGWPAVPFHALPRLHARVAEALPHAREGYLRIHARSLRAALRLGPPLE